MDDGSQEPKCVHHKEERYARISEDGEPSAGTYARGTKRKVQAILAAAETRIIHNREAGRCASSIGAFPSALESEHIFTNPSHILRVF